MQKEVPKKQELAAANCKYYANFAAKIDSISKIIDRLIEG